MSKYAVERSGDFWMVMDSEGDKIAETESQATAREIARALNCRPELLAALGGGRSYLFCRSCEVLGHEENGDFRGARCENCGEPAGVEVLVIDATIARAAIALAKGEA